MKIDGWSRWAIAIVLFAVAGCTSSVADSGDVGVTREAQSAEVSVSSAANTSEKTEKDVAEVDTTATTALRYFVDDAGVAIRGTDPVAYFTEGAAVAGSSEFSHSWGNATWHFASAENRDLFAANPGQYAPQYGGFCAWAVSEGYTASIDPEAWRIVDARLYLNYDKRIQQRWERDIPGNVSKADANWPGVLDES